MVPSCWCSRISYLWLGEGRESVKATADVVYRNEKRGTSGFGAAKAVSEEFEIYLVAF